MDYKSIEETQPLLYGAAALCGRDMRDVLRAWLREPSGRDRWPRPALPGVSGSAAIPCTRWKPVFGQKGALISTRLSQAASRNEKHWKSRQAGLWEPSPEGSRLLFVSQLLHERSGWCAGLGSSYSPPLPHSSGRGKHRNAAERKANSHCSQVRDFGTTCLFLRGKGWAVPVLPCSLGAHGASLSPL